MEDEEAEERKKENLKLQELQRKPCEITAKQEELRAWEPIPVRKHVFGLTDKQFFIFLIQSIVLGYQCLWG